MRNFNCCLCSGIHIQRNFKDEESSRLYEITGSYVRHKKLDLNIETYILLHILLLETGHLRCQKEASRYTTILPVCMTG